MAKALIIDDAFGKLADAYYALVPDEPISSSDSLAIKSRTTIPKTSLKTLLSSIKAGAKGGDDLVVVAHGNKAGMTMKFNADEKSDVRANSASLNILTGSESPADKAKQLRIAEATVKELLGLIDDCQKIKLGHIAFRGCSIGINTVNLDVLKDLLGAKAVSASDLLSTFGETVAPWIQKKPGEFNKWKQSYGRNSTIWDDKVMFYSLLKPDHSTKIGLFARNRDDIAGWMQAVFDSSRKAIFEQFMASKIPVHYLSDTKPIPPLDKGYAARIFTS